MPLTNPKRASLQNFALLVFPFVFFCYLSRDILFTQAGLPHDSPYFYYIIKYFLDAIVQGVYPVWNPFQNWGRLDNFDVRFFGEFNPFFLLVPLIHAFKVPYFIAYKFFLALYWLLGCAGFYLLAQRLFHQRLYAYISYLLLLFSSAIGALYTDPVIILVLVPMIWLYYFLLGFHQAQHRYCLFGMTLCLMLLAVTYSVFHFLTVLLSVMLFYIYVNAGQLPEVIRIWWKGLNKQKAAIFLCVVALAISCVPGVQWLQSARQDDSYVMKFLHDYDSKDVGRYSLKAIKVGNSAFFVSLEHPFSGYENLHVADVAFFYINTFLFLLLVMGALNRINKRSVVWLGSILLIFTISLAYITPVHEFLYNTVFFFKKFRNLYYFLVYITPLLILLGVEQFRRLIDSADGRQRLPVTAWIVAAHVLFLLYLHGQPLISASTYWTLGLSLPFMVMLVWIPEQRRNGVAVLTAAGCLLAIQPAQLYSAEFFDMSEREDVVYENTVNRASFQFIRPDIKEDVHLRFPKIRHLIKVPRDSSGFIKTPPLHFIGMKYAYDLQQEFAFQDLSSYVRHKFWAYDDVQENAGTLRDFERTQIEGRGAVAAIAGQLHSVPNQLTRSAPGRPIAEGEGTLKVKAFDHNQLTVSTAFSHPKFLVYNDIYTPEWRALLDGRAIPIYRANYAFKGVLLPPGEHTLKFIYGPPWQPILNWWIQLTFLGMLLLTVWKWVWKNE